MPRKLEAEVIRRVQEKLEQENIEEMLREVIDKAVDDVLANIKDTIALKLRVIAESYLEPEVRKMLEEKLSVKPL